MAAAVFGALLPARPLSALGLIGLVPLAFWAPTACLAGLLAITVLVPFEIQDQLAVFGGRGTPSLLIVDVLLLLSVLRVALLVVRGRLVVTAPLLAAGALMVGLAVALLLGILRGFDGSEAGHEARRVMLGVGTFIVAWPVLQEVRSRRRLQGALLVVGSLLAAWGLLQWVLDIGYTTSGDAGVRSGVPFTTAGRGQLQGGLFAYPVAVILAFAVLFFTRVRVAAVPLWTVAIMALNAICLLLTYERTFWGAAAMGCLFVIAICDRRLQRLGARLPAIAVVVFVVLLVAVTSGELQTALQRLVSVAQYGTDISVEYRIEEARVVLDAIRERPLLGSGFGSTVTWGKQGVFGTITTPFSHNGYMWLAWKIGIPAALIITLAMGYAVMRRETGGEDPAWRGLRAGSRGAVVGLLVVNMTFPVYDVLGITAVAGFLVAVSLCPPVAMTGWDRRGFAAPAPPCTPDPTRG